MRTNKLEVEIIHWDDEMSPPIFLKSGKTGKPDVKNEIALMLVSLKKQIS